MRAVQTDWTKGSCDCRSRSFGSLGWDKAVLRGRESYLLCTSQGHTGAQVKQRSRLRMHASLQRCCRYWRSGDYISRRQQSPCTGDMGTKGTTMGDLMGRGIRSWIWKAPGQYIRNAETHRDTTKQSIIIVHCEHCLQSGWLACRMASWGIRKRRGNLLFCHKTLQTFSPE